MHIKPFFFFNWSKVHLKGYTLSIMNSGFFNVLSVFEDKGNFRSLDFLVIQYIFIIKFNSERTLYSSFNFIRFSISVYCYLDLQ